MTRTPGCLGFVAIFLAACTDGSSPADGPVEGADLAGTDGSPSACTSRSECASAREARASARLTSIVASPDELSAFLTAVPKGGDLHNHLTGAVYAETYLGWAMADGNCVNSTSYSAVFPNQCSASTQPAPSMGTFFDSILRAWSMKDFVAGAETGHDHFFSTFGKYGLIAGAHRDDTLADVAKRAADENQLYVETMFNLGKNVGTLAASTYTQSAAAMTAADLPAFYDALVAKPEFVAEVDSDAAVVNSATAGYKATLGCGGASPPPACKVEVRFIAQVARTGANDVIFGQLVSAFEMAAKTGAIVGANLSSPEDETASLKNYELHMQMLDFLYNKYTVTKKSPLHITLHAGELVPKYLPPAYSTANTFHVRRAVEVGHAERIGHAIDVLSETDSAMLLDEMRDRNVMVEICLSSNIQILEVSGTNHPLAAFLEHDVPVALATDDQGVSRSSMAGEYMRAVLDQNLSYAQLKRMARTSLEHAFLPGASLWEKLGETRAVADCAPTESMGLGDAASGACEAFLAQSERARMQWELERRFTEFENKQ